MNAMDEQCAGFSDTLGYLEPALILLNSIQEENQSDPSRLAGIPDADVRDLKLTLRELTQDVQNAVGHAKFYLELQGRPWGAA